MRQREKAQREQVARARARAKDLGKGAWPFAFHITLEYGSNVIYFHCANDFHSAIKLKAWIFAEKYSCQNGFAFFFSLPFFFKFY